MFHIMTIYRATITCSSSGSDQGEVWSLLIFNNTTTIKSPKMLENISKFILIDTDFNKDNRLIISMEQMPFEYFKSV